MGAVESRITRCSRRNCLCYPLSPIPQPSTRAPPPVCPADLLGRVSARKSGRTLPHHQRLPRSTHISPCHRAHRRWLARSVPCIHRIHGHHAPHWRYPRAPGPFPPPTPHKGIPDRRCRTAGLVDVVVDAAGGPVQGGAVGRQRGRQRSLVAAADLEQAIAVLSVKAPPAPERLPLYLWTQDRQEANAKSDLFVCGCVKERARAHIRAIDTRTHARTHARTHKDARAHTHTTL